MGILLALKFSLLSIVLKILLWEKVVLRMIHLEIMFFLFNSFRFINDRTADGNMPLTCSLSKHSMAMRAFHSWIMRASCVYITMLYILIIKIWILTLSAQIIAILLTILVDVSWIPIFSPIYFIIFQIHMQANRIGSIRTLMSLIGFLPF